jgi:NAD(P)-dependent dehydrogenase (short-subunit alcohol dehydrogenase family)
MDIAGSVVFITGANRGLGRAFAKELRKRGASKVYAGVRDPSTVTDSDVIPIRLDITDPAQVEAAAKAASDTTILINNAGIATKTSTLTASLEDVRREIDTNYIGTLHMAQTFAPVLKANGGGTLVNMLSVLSWYASPTAGTYSAAKAASWSATNSLRVLLREQGTHVLAVHSGYIDTDMTSGITDPKLDAADVAVAMADALQAGQEEVLVDDLSRNVKASLADDLNTLYAPAS